MLFIHVARILEWIFFVGLAGSLVVSVAAFVGDLHVFFEKNEGPQASGMVLHILPGQPLTSRRAVDSCI